MKRDGQEIDTPGHSNAIAKSHPEHIACDGQLRHTSEATVNFTAGMFSAVADVASSYLVGTGGDELTNCYAADPRSQDDLGGRTLDQSLSQFISATHGALREKGKTPVVWQGTAWSFV
jgi:hexosaminidase